MQWGGCNQFLTRGGWPKYDENVIICSLFRSRHAEEISSASSFATVSLSHGQFLEKVWRTIRRRFVLCFLYELHNFPVVHHPLFMRLSRMGGGPKYDGNVIISGIFLIPSRRIYFEFKLFSDPPLVYGNAMAWMQSVPYTGVAQI